MLNKVRPNLLKVKSKVINFGPVIQITLIVPQIDNHTLEVSCYYIDGLLIDSGPLRGLEAIKAIFQDKPVYYLVNTHHHEDHAGNNFWFTENKECGPALVHKKAVPMLRQEDGFFRPLPFYRKVSWGKPPKSEAAPIGKEIQTERFCFKVIETPGHSQDHICLIENDQGWLFTGDLFINEHVKTMLKYENIDDLLHSLYMVLQYDIDILFCSTGRVIEKGAKEAIQRKIEYIEEMKQKVQLLINKGYSAKRIRDQLLGKEDTRYIFTQGGYAKINFINAILRSISQDA